MCVGTIIFLSWLAFGDAADTSRLGPPIGSEIVIEGVRETEGKVGTQTLRVSVIDSKPLAAPVQIWIDNVESLPANTAIALRGRERVRLIGQPGAQAPLQRQHYFFASAIIRPEGLSLQAHTQPDDRGDPNAALDVASLARLPVREVTIFKDGHAFVLQEGAAAVSPRGTIVLDDLPAPVLGTFWPFSADPNVPLVSITAESRKLAGERNTRDLLELLSVNIGKEAVIKEQDGPEYAAKVRDVVKRTPPAAPPGAAEPGSPPPPPGGLEPIVLLETWQGVKVVNVGRIRDVTFKDAPSTAIAEPSERGVLTMQLPPSAAGREVSVGLAYLQKGLRWIPEYEVTLEPGGQARIRLQATLINEMIDLEGATAHLVIGVPTFAFKDTLDPMSLRQTVAQLSQYFQTDAQTAYAFSNAIMTQRARAGEYRGDAVQQPGAAPADGPEPPEGAKNEDLFIFTVKNVTLRKGARMVLPVAEFAIPYEDQFALDLPFSPPDDVRCNVSTEQQLELAKLFRAPKVMHRIKLTNRSAYPLTTAPALIRREGRLLAQSMMIYAAVGACSEIDVTTAVDIKATKHEAEKRRIPNALDWNGNKLTRVDLVGKLTLTNFKDKTVTVRVTRSVLGEMDKASAGGAVSGVNLLEADDVIGSPKHYWWRWYNWPWWWMHVNGIGKAEWSVALEPGQSAELEYAWHYFTQ